MAFAKEEITMNLHFVTNKKFNYKINSIYLIN